MQKSSQKITAKSFNVPLYKLKIEATKPTYIVQDKRNIQVLQSNFKQLYPMLHEKARNIRRPRQKICRIKDRKSSPSLTQL